MPNASIYTDRVLIESPQKHRWQDSSVCAQTDPEVFFPNTGGSYADAKKFCNSCLVRSNCLEKAMAEEGSAHRYDRFGMFGGLTPAERYKLFKQREAARKAKVENEAQIAA